MINIQIRKRIYLFLEVFTKIKKNKFFKFTHIITNTYLCMCMWIRNYLYKLFIIVMEKLKLNVYKYNMYFTKKKFLAIKWECNFLNITYLICYIFQDVLDFTFKLRFQTRTTVSLPAEHSASDRKARVRGSPANTKGTLCM